MSDFWFGTIMFLAGFVSCFGIFFILCYQQEIREAINLFIWDVKYYYKKFRGQQ